MEVMESDNSEAVKATRHTEERRFENYAYLARILIMSWYMNNTWLSLVYRLKHDCTVAVNKMNYMC